MPHSHGASKKLIHFILLNAAEHFFQAEPRQGNNLHAGTQGKECSRH